MIGQRVILEPTEEDLKEWEEKRLLSAEKTTKGHIAMVQLMDDRLSHIGQMGVITKIPFMGRREITVRFDDGSTMGADWHYFLVAVAVDRPDWRPDETLPEDYYAL